MASSSRRMTAREFRQKMNLQPKAKALYDEPTKLYNFGPYQLFSFKENKFNTPPQLQVDENQQVLLDNLWNSKTLIQKQKSLQALAQYLSSIQKKSASKNFSYYVVTKGFHTGVFINGTLSKRS